MRYAEFLEAWRVAHCKRYVRCDVARDLDSCLRVVGQYEIDPDRSAALDAGTLVFHAGVAEACLDAVDDLSCDGTSREARLPPCQHLLTGTLGDDAPCAFGSACISGECWLEAELACDGDGCCRGACVGETPVEYEPAGGRCRFKPCVDAWCDGSACEALLPEGADCALLYDRWGGEVCDYGLVCKNGKCMRTVDRGESCIYDPCRNIGDICGPDYVCIRRRALGEACYDVTECMWGLACDLESYRCVERVDMPPPPVERLPVGAACTISFPSTPCEVGAFCDVVAGSYEGVCTLPKPVGAPCLGDWQCASKSCNHVGVCIAGGCF